MGDDSRAQHCDCGNEMYRVKFNPVKEKVWAECAECGRPTRSLGDGVEKQREWEAQQ